MERGCIWMNLSRKYEKCESLSENWYEKCERGVKMGEKEEKLKEVIEIIQESSDEAECYKDESEFESGAAFAYRCVLNLFKEFGIGE